MKKIILACTASLGLLFALNAAAQEKNNMNREYMEAMNKMHQPMMDAAMIKMLMFLLLKE